MSKLLDAVIELANEYPDAVYERSQCRYTYGKCDPDEGCLIGQALVRGGFVTFEQLRVLDQQRGYDVRGLCVKLGLVIDDVVLLNKIQANQDQGLTWKEAINVG